MNPDSGMMLYACWRSGQCSDTTEWKVGAISFHNSSHALLTPVISNFSALQDNSPVAPTIFAWSHLQAAFWFLYLSLHLNLDSWLKSFVIFTPSFFVSSFSLAFILLSCLCLLCSAALAMRIRALFWWEFMYTWCSFWGELLLLFSWGVNAWPSGCFCSQHKHCKHKLA